MKYTPFYIHSQENNSQQERIALLERSDALKENQLRTLREERSKLSTMLSNEQKVFQKLEFELQVVQTLEASLKEQILLFEKRTAEGSSFSISNSTRSTCHR